MHIYLYTFYIFIYVLYLEGVFLETQYIYGFDILKILSVGTYNLFIA